MKMKRKLALILIVVMIFSLVGCNTTGTDQKEPPKEETTTTEAPLTFPAL